MSDYRSLDAWNLAHATRLAVYRATAAYPAAEQFGLVAQTRRAASSIATNIAEGAGRGSNRDFGRFVSIAIGSTNETEDHLFLARELGYLPPDVWRDLSVSLERIRSMLSRLRSFLAGNG
ncbi:MAG: hypothetical protein A2146_01540 [Actinobacteria bacterium RBG_16_67_10]|nr:MAG: hypothetical protein A2146_01540 [Actinobacteria bacterium RBG_16_67_10]